MHENSLLSQNSKFEARLKHPSTIKQLADE